MENKKIIFGIPKDRFIIIAICLMIIWSGCMLLLYFKAEEITNDPCTVCARRMGTEVNCFIGGGMERQRIYYPNKTIEDVRP